MPREEKKTMKRNRWGTTIKLIQPSTKEAKNREEEDECFAGLY